MKKICRNCEYFDYHIDSSSFAVNMLIGSCSNLKFRNGQIRVKRFNRENNLYNIAFYDGEKVKEIALSEFSEDGSVSYNNKLISFNEDSLFYTDAEGFASFNVGRDFGCIHFKEGVTFEEDYEEDDFIMKNINKINFFIRRSLYYKIYELINLDDKLPADTLYKYWLLASMNEKVVSLLQRCEYNFYDNINFNFKNLLNSGVLL